jgi:hypothetical protein
MELLSEFRDMIGQPFRDPDGKINTPVKGIAPDDKVHSGKKGGFIEIGVNHDPLMERITTGINSGLGLE